MPVTAFPLLVEHTYWGLDRVLDALSRVDASALDADPPAAGMSSARHTIRHTYGFDRYWIPKFVTDMDEPPQLPDDLTEARAVWEPTRDRLRRYLEESDDSVLATRFEIRYGDDEVDAEGDRCAVSVRRAPCAAPCGARRHGHAARSEPRRARLLGLHRRVRGRGLARSGTSAMGCTGSGSARAASPGSTAPPRRTRRGAGGCRAGR